MPPRYEYGPQYRISFGGPITPGVKILIIINVVVYFVELLIQGLGDVEAFSTFLHFFALDPRLVFGRFYIWQLVTYMFLHATTGVFHILFNMLILWMFGGDIERVWGTRRFVRYYLITGIGAGIANCAFLQPSTIGASGAIFGIIVAFAMLFPTRRVLFMFIFPMTARQFALLLGAIELVSMGALTPDGVARIAHLGGALTGYLLIKGIWDPRRLWYDLKWKMRRRRFKTLSRDDSGSDRDRFYPYH